MAAVVNVSVPGGWHELSQVQLRFAFTVMANVYAATRNKRYLSREDYAAQTSAQIRTICFFKWADITAVCPYADGWLVRHGKKEFKLTAEVIVDAVSHLDWMMIPPPDPVRLDSIDGAEAIPADISAGLSFDSWLACENLWQQYQVSENDALLRSMAEILYNKEGIRLSPAETLSIFYWWAAVKNLVSALFPNFFKRAGSEEGEAALSDYDVMRRNIDAQIRALTKGDITKESEVLALDAMRALTELDAQAREYDELREKYPTS